LVWKGIREKKLTLIFPVYLFFTNLFALAFLIKTSNILFFIYLFPYHFLIAAAGIYFLGFHIIGLLKQARSTKDGIIRSLLKDGEVIEKFFIFCFLTVLITFPVVVHLGTLKVYPPTYVISSLTLNPLSTENRYTLIEYEVGNYISSITKEGDKIWTSEPAIAFFADRLIVPPRSPNFPFQGFFAAHEYWIEASPNHIADGWEDQPPKVIVLITGPGSNAFVPYPDECLYDPLKANDYLAGPLYNTQTRRFIDSNYIINKTFPFETYYYQIWMLNVTRYTVVHGKNGWDYFYQTYGPMLGAYYNTSETCQDYYNYEASGLASRYTLVKINDNLYDLYVTFGDMIGTWVRVNDYFWDYYPYNATTGLWTWFPSANCTLQKVDTDHYRWWANVNGKMSIVGNWVRVNDVCWDYYPIESFDPLSPYYIPTIFSFRIICLDSPWLE
jgi:hypothetical protein